MSHSATGTRAREPDECGYASAADGVRLYWEVHGGGSSTIVLLPPNPISHSRIWKAQVHYLARHHRVVAFDGRGNGKSDSPDPSGLWLDEWRAGDCLSVMDATATDSAVLAGICSDGVWPSIQIAAARPERVRGVVALCPGVPLLSPPHPWRGRGKPAFEQDPDDPQGWDKENRHSMLRDYAGYLEFFLGEMFPEPHSTKPIEDAVAYALDGPVEAMLMRDGPPVAPTKEDAEELCRRVRCPVLVIQGDRDNCQPAERGFALAELTGAEHVVIAGAGHIPIARHPVRINRLMREFAERVAPQPPRPGNGRAAVRGQRALLVSSPIGLGHVWRDVAIADELRGLHPGLEIEWLAQHPVTTVLEARRERIHPASAELAPEAAHVDAETREHELNAFEMLRRLDEIFCANFMVFDDLVRSERFDLWIADEAWEVDYFLHENPALKTAPYAWLTDFVGIVPMPEGGEREAFLAADHNAQMVEHVARHPQLRDRAIFVGDPEDIVAGRLGPGLPAIADWTREHFRFSGYVTGFDAAATADRARLRAELGYGGDEKVCIVTAGGSVAGIHLFERAAAAFPEAAQRIPGLRMILVAGPRIDPRSLPHGDGLETCGYVDELHRHLAACDVAISHGGLSTTMELTATSRPFLYFPLRRHFEQNHHVAHRLHRHGAGRRMDFDRDGPSEIAAAMAEEIGREPRYRPVGTGGAARAARAIGELLTATGSARRPPRPPRSRGPGAPGAGAARPR